MHPLKILLVACLLGPLLAAAGSGPKQHHPKQVWRGFSGPAYLPAHLPRPPAQHVLDSLAAVARHRPAKFVAIPTQQRPAAGAAPSH